MVNVGILTDTSACIPAAMVQELGIELVSYRILRGEESLRDMVDVQPAEFAAYLETAQTLPKTTHASPAQYLEALEQLAQRTNEILVLTMTWKATGGYQTCHLAVDMLHERFPDVHVEILDTKTVALCLGWAAIQAARAAREGATLQEVRERAEKVAASSMLIHTADTLRYLYMGGRVGLAQNLVGNLLNIKPIVGMHEGVIVPMGTARSRPKAYARMVELACERFGEGARVRAGFTHCAALEQLELLKVQMLSRLNAVEVITTDLTPILAVHSGPGTVGVSIIPADV